MKPVPCPCGLPASYAKCCEPYHRGTPAPDPQALMRSRYTAYALGLTDYLRDTWHPSTRPADLDAHTPPQPKWIGLQVLECARQDDSHGTVHFVARCRIGGRAQRLEETSRFVLEAGQWYYLDGEIT